MPAAEGERCSRRPRPTRALCAWCALLVSIKRPSLHPPAGTTRRACIKRVRAMRSRVQWLLYKYHRPRISLSARQRHGARRAPRSSTMTGRPRCARSTVADSVQRRTCAPPPPPPRRPRPALTGSAVPMEHFHAKYASAAPGGSGRRGGETAARYRQALSLHALYPTHLVGRVGKS